MNESAFNRRKLLGAAAVGAAAIGTTTLAGTTAAAAATTASGSSGRVPRNNISVQLYTLRNILGQELEETLTELSEIGYGKVEHAGFVGLSAADFKKALDNAGLQATSGHVGIPQPFDAETWKRSLEDAAIIGNKYIVHPFFGLGADGPVRSSAVYRQLAHDLNTAGEMARKAGLHLGYHNHHLEFTKQDGGTRTGFDVLMSQTDPRYVHFELDLYWAWRGTADPVDLFNRLRGRVRQVHVKDVQIDTSSFTNAPFADPGTGLIDFGRIFQRAKEAGLVEYIVERDDAGSPPRTPEQALETARVGYDYLKGLRF
ncbi:sugar phosphate isomerase/epimerase family protein [Terracoccus luteus]|jgi:sugar phosphate isomerase/epimerase|uniref:Sugar phosphate isomerase/epimerase n=1 Tax=Terracoccus luteus TaxID=53356 RepID=A0A495XXW1_9MICO|nr:sugar phosphate isomerase/epimerase [Terracoccus luteus]MBB2988249.1 sugar phosphate isomerase/epimerase [Terracoccus luteus]MCP2173884.1 sugar phosphate isomerase/epimerase [Terracoccus luteus]RKT77995.1 sugar phosphate isomerase/epimerase [Terracoccus luteus]